MALVKKEGSARIFNNPFLEVFTKTTPAIHVLTYTAVIAFLLSRNEHALWLATALVISGLFAWTLMEYLMHRYLFHISHKKLQYFIHGVHHEYPRDKARLLMPPVPGLIYAALLFGIHYIFLRSYTFPFMAGVVAGYMLYAFIHYILHTHKPVKAFRYLWTHHHRHHNPAHQHTAFGVSTPLWDYVFGTMPVNEKKGEEIVGAG